MESVKYNIYPSILDAFQDYLNSEDVWLRYWGGSDEPSMSLEDFEQKQFSGLIDKINRVPIAWEDSEKVDAGTTFNEIVDCLILNRNSDKMQIVKEFDSLDENKVVAIRAIYNGRSFQFPLTVCREFSDYYKGAIPQVYTEAVLQTKYGSVKLYGYIDELMPTSIHDIKVTGSYEAWKFKDKWQRVVYPYCINENGSNITDFEYNILLYKATKAGYNTYEVFAEYYNYTDDDKDRLTVFVEQFIEFLEENRNLITDKKIFNEL